MTGHHPWPPKVRSLPVVDHLSYSQAATVNRCPRAWWLKYVTGVLTVASPAMEHGKRVDDLVTAWIGGATMEYELDQSARAAWIGGATMEYGLDQSARVWEDARALYHASLDWNIVGTQVKHEGRIAGVGVPVVGYSDALLADGTVVDWKCSRQYRPDWETQVSLYTILPAALEGWSPNGECRVVRVYNGKVSVYDFQANNLAAQFVRDAWERIEAPRHPMTPGQHCGWCGVAEECAVVAALESSV